MTFLIVLGVCVVVIGLIWLLFAPQRHAEVGRGPATVERRHDVTDE